MPTVKQYSEGDTVYSKAYVDAIKNGLKPNVVLEREYRAVGAITKESDDALAGLQEKMREAIVQLHAGVSEEDKQSVYSEFLKLKFDYEQMVLERNSLFQHSAESKAEIAKISCFLWQCVFDESHNPLWKTQEEFLESKTSRFVEEVIKKFILYLMSLDESEAKFNEVLEKFLAPKITAEESGEKATE